MQVMVVAMNVKKMRVHSCLLASHDSIGLRWVPRFF